MRGINRNSARPFAFALVGPDGVTIKLIVRKVICRWQYNSLPEAQTRTPLANSSQQERRTSILFEEQIHADCADYAGSPFSSGRSSDGNDGCGPGDSRARRNYAARTARRASDA